MASIENIFLRVMMAEAVMSEAKSMAKPAGFPGNVCNLFSIRKYLPQANFLLFQTMA